MRLARLTAMATLTLGLLAAPLAARAQQTGKVCRVGFLTGGSAPSPFIRLIRDALGPLGYVEGQNLIEARHAQAKLDRLPALAAELVVLKVDLTLTTRAPAARAAKQATATIPIVFNLGADPVQEGFVASLARPDGNLTGFALGLYEDNSPPSRTVCLRLEPSRSSRAETPRCRSRRGSAIWS